MPRFKLSLALLTLLAFISGCASRNQPTQDNNFASRISFGSCLQQWKSQPILQSISNQTPNAFIFLGDNMYADVGSYLELPKDRAIAKAYNDLASSDDFAVFRKQASERQMPLLAVWDDHDYGKNDAGNDFLYRLESKKQFRWFFGIKETATDIEAPGIYRTEYLNLNEVNVQVLLLDTRSFRSPLLRAVPSEQCPHINITANDNPSATILGAQQWQWLERELEKPADLRILVSSIQVLPSEHCFEKWSNFPLERQRLIKLLDKPNARNTVILSGDRHLAEISKITTKPGIGSIYEITSSGLNSAIGPNRGMENEPNKLRVLNQNITENNFGSIEILKLDQELQVSLEIYNEQGQQLQEHNILIPRHQPHQINASSF